jgi:hypothetical protein
LIVGVIANVAIFGVLLFLPAGTFDWWRAWAFLGVIIIGTVATMVGVFATNQELLDERMKVPLQKGQPLADKIVPSLARRVLRLDPFIPWMCSTFPAGNPPGW